MGPPREPYCNLPRAGGRICCSTGLLIYNMCRLSLTHHERPEDINRKAKDWGGLEKICKIDPVETSKNSPLETCAWWWGDL